MIMLGQAGRDVRIENGLPKPLKASGGEMAEIEISSMYNGV